MEWQPIQMVDLCLQNHTCGSNYILKMSNYSKGEWCDIVDGLYWRFTDKHRSFYEKNARMSF